MLSTTRSFFLVIAAIAMTMLFADPINAQPYQPDQGYPGSSSPPAMAATSPRQLATLPAPPAQLRQPLPTSGICRGISGGHGDGKSGWPFEVNLKKGRVISWPGLPNEKGSQEQDLPLIVDASGYEGLATGRNGGTLRVSYWGKYNGMDFLYALHHYVSTRQFKDHDRKFLMSCTP